MKRIVAVLFSLIFVISLVSCGAKDTTQAEITEASEIGTVEELTEESHENSETEPAETTIPKKIYADASQNDFDLYLAVLSSFAFDQCWSGGYKSEKASFTDDIRAILNIISIVYGEKEQNYDNSVFISDSFQGITHYNYSDNPFDSDEKAYEENRKIIDPLFKFKKYDNNYFQRFSSADASVVEWVEKELLGGETIDRNKLYEDPDYGTACYYCDGRYYFLSAEHNGRVPTLKFSDIKQSEDGTYSFNCEGEWYSSISFKTTAALIKKDGYSFWKIFSIDWNLD